jgi:hypothetical protein
MMAKQPKDSVPQKMQVTFDGIVSLTDPVCQEHLTAEYAALCRRLAAVLSRKRPSPLSRGRPKSWAGAILYTIARVSFLFDPSQTPHMRADELCRAAGVSQGTASAKSTQIMDLLDIVQLHPAWTLPSQVDQNPLAWMIEVNGLLVDARHAPRQIQEEAFRLGLIPYLPGDEAD